MAPLLEYRVEKVLDPACDSPYNTGRVFGKACNTACQTSGRSQDNVEWIRESCSRLLFTPGRNVSAACYRRRYCNASRRCSCTCASMRRRTYATVATTTTDNHRRIGREWWIRRVGWVGRRRVHRVVGFADNHDSSTSRKQENS